MEFKRKNNTTINTENRKKTIWRRKQRIAKKAMRE